MLTLLLALACKDRTPDDSGPVDLGWGEGPCTAASEAEGRRVCAHRIPSREGWGLLTVPASAVDQLRATKYLVPVDEAQPLPTTYLNVNAYTLHYDLLSQAFGEYYPGLTRSDYVSMVLGPEGQVYWAGNLAEYLDLEGGTFFGFTVWDDPADAAATVTYAEVLAVYHALLDSIAPELLEAAPLTFVPNSAHQREAAATWDAEFPIRGVDPVTYEAYTQAVGYGTARFFTLTELEAATEQASFGFQDLLVLEEAPFDVERVVAGFVTGSRQGELSHLNVRAAARGTPNCYVQDPFEALAGWEDQLVRFECAAETWSIAAATLEEAQAWWDALRPDPVTVPTPDLETTAFVGLLDAPTATASERAANLAAYGAKGANLATLYQRIPAALQLEGFLVPFAWYDQFLHTSTWTVDLGLGAAEYSFADTLAAWHADPEFLSDAKIRRDRLADLREAMEDAPQDPALVAALYDALVLAFGDDTTMARFRSSSNAEDSLEFSGAGLYESNSVCAADSVDADTAGPSRCDPDQDKERTIERGLGKTWASLWATEAWEEREWYGIDHLQVAMGVLVNTRAKDEQINIVAFTGDPNTGDDRFLVNSQLGAWDVVSAEPGVYPEKVRLTLDTAGEVVDIERVSASSQVEPGGQVMSDAQLEALGGAFWDIQQVFPVDAAVPAGGEVLLDTEWKVLEDGTLIIKQIRPFLREL